MFTIMHSLPALVVSVSVFVFVAFPGHTLAISPRYAAYPDRFMVETSNGPISGHAATNAPRVGEYLGVPYAQPPVGDLRFAPPVRHSGSAPQEAKNWVGIARACSQLEQSRI
jgi:hypothetical protein